MSLIDRANLVERIQSAPIDNFIPAIFNGYIIVSNHSALHTRQTQYFYKSRTISDIILSENVVEMFCHNRYRYIAIIVSNENENGEFDTHAHGFFVRGDILAIGTFTGQPFVSPIGQCADVVADNPDGFLEHFRQRYGRIEDDNFEKWFQLLSKKNFSVELDYHNQLHVKE